MAVCSGINSGGVDKVFGSGNLTLVSHMQEKHPTCFAMALAPLLCFLLCSLSSDRLCFHIENLFLF